MTFLVESSVLILTWIKTARLRLDLNKLGVRSSVAAVLWKDGASADMSRSAMPAYLHPTSQGSSIRCELFCSVPLPLVQILLMWVSPSVLLALAGLSLASVDAKVCSPHTASVLHALIHHSTQSFTDIPALTDVYARSIYQI